MKTLTRLVVVALVILVLSETIFAITFSVRFTQGGKPLTRAIINFVTVDRHDTVVRVITDDDGRCVLRDIPEGKYDLKIIYRTYIIGASIELPPPNGKSEFETGYGRPEEPAYWR